MKLQFFPRLRIDDDGMRVEWEQGYHRQISGQSVHIANVGRYWAACDDDSGSILVTAPSMHECIARCEKYIASHSAVFVSDEYVALCKLFQALRKGNNED